MLGEVHSVIRVGCLLRQKSRDNTFIPALLEAVICLWLICLALSLVLYWRGVFPLRGV